MLVSIKLRSTVSIDLESALTWLAINRSAAFLGIAA